MSARFGAVQSPKWPLRAPPPPPPLPPPPPPPLFGLQDAMKNAQAESEAHGVAQAAQASELLHATESLKAELAAQHAQLQVLNQELLSCCLK